MNIEGIPDGWELVRVGSVRHGEFHLDGKGHPVKWNSAITSEYANYVIIRKIEKPKRYRPFNDPIEAETLLGFPLRLKVDHKNKGIFIGITSLGFQIGLSHWEPKDAFDCFERLDGTPFGIEVTE